MTTEFKEALQKMPSFIMEPLDENTPDSNVFTQAMFFYDYAGTIRRALLIADKLSQKDVVMCVKKQHLPEHDGATGYFYYEEIEE